RTYFQRALVRTAAGDKAGAEADMVEGRRREPRDVVSRIHRGFWKQRAADPKGAIADFDAAMAMNSRSQDALKYKAMVLADSLNRPAAAVPVLNTPPEMYHHPSASRCGRAGR